MNFYKHYLGDFQRDTGHLSLTERGAYLALIHHYYATETPLPNDHAALCRIAGAFTKAERDAVKSILSFFEIRDGVLWHQRIEAELEKQVGRCDKNRAIALAREDRKRAEKEAQIDHENSTNRAQNVQQNVSRTFHQNNTIPEPEPEPVIPKDKGSSSTKTFGGELQISSPQASSILMNNIILSIPLIDKTDFHVDQETLEEWRAAYPAVDVPQELREMRQWCIANPSQRKTKRGVYAFVTRWLGKEQDKGGIRTQGQLGKNNQVKHAAAHRTLMRMSGVGVLIGSQS
jgi:uncharacterized protein YdaU (DUF1376 family)